MPGRFTRNIEDFTCEMCGFEVKGTGYTDHCPKCLWGKHVDVNPGDRACECKGLLKPLRVELDRSKSMIVYKCMECGIVRRFAAATDDNLDAAWKQ